MISHSKSTQRTAEVKVKIRKTYQGLTPKKKTWCRSKVQMTVQKGQGLSPGYCPHMSLDMTQAIMQPAQQPFLATYHSIPNSSRRWLSTCPPEKISSPRGIYALVHGVHSKCSSRLQETKFHPTSSSISNTPNCNTVSPKH